MYRHYKNGKLYILLDYVKVQINDVWEEAVLYKEAGGELKFVRPEEEFFKKFEKIG